MISRPIPLACVLLGGTMFLMTMLGLPPGHSVQFNYAWSVQYADALTWTNPLPRYLPGLWSGLGGQDFFFYAPLPFWFLAVFVDPLCPGCAASTEFVLGASVVLVASGYAMFAFLRCFVANGPAAFGAVVYCLLPYHLLIDWIERQAAGEFTAYAFIPLVALGIERIRRNEGGGWILTLGIAGTALSHLPTTLLVAHPFGALVLVLVGVQPGGLAARLRLLARFAWFAGLGLAVVSFYWLPAILLLDTVSPATLFAPYFEAWRWLYGGVELQPNPQFALRILVSALASVPLLLGAVCVARGPVLLWLLVPAALAIFLNTAVTAPIWREWIIAKVQFPWRLMTVVDFATALAAGILWARAVDRVGWLILTACMLAALLPAALLATTIRFGATDAPPEQRYDVSYGAMEYLSPEMTEVLGRRLGQPLLDHFDQDAIAASLRAMPAEFQAIHGMPDLRDRGARSFTVVAPRDATTLSLPVQYWFLWQAETADGTALATRANPDFGTLDIIAPTGGFDAGPVSVSLAWHASEVWGGIFSLLAVLALLATLRVGPVGRA